MENMTCLYEYSRFIYSVLLKNMQTIVILSVQLFDSFTSVRIRSVTHQNWINITNLKLTIDINVFCRHSTTVIFSSATKPHELLCSFTPSKSVMWFGCTGVLQGSFILQVTEQTKCCWLFCEHLLKVHK